MSAKMETDVLELIHRVQNATAKYDQWRGEKEVLEDEISRAQVELAEYLRSKGLINS